MRIDPDGTVVLSRRNLLALLAKLDGNPPDSACTIGSPHMVMVRAEDDAVHYGDRRPGQMHPATEQAITRSVGGVWKGGK